MKCRKINFFRWLLAIFGLLILPLSIALASSAPPLSGTYQVVRHTAIGDRVHVSLQVHLVNGETRDLHIDRMTLWDFSHPAKDSSATCSVMLHGMSSADAAGEFTIPREEYLLWKRGVRPRIVLGIAEPNGRRSSAVVRLNLAAGGKGN